MEKKFTFYARTIAYTAVTFGALIINSLTPKTYAQNCSSSAVVFSEDFGAGVGSVSNPDIVGLTYQPTGSLANEGTYRVINDAQQKPEWHASEDASPNNIDGRMLVVNGIHGDFYIHQINRPAGFLPNNFSANLFLMNVNTLGTCAPNPLLPVMIMRVEYLSEANTWLPLTGSPYTAPAVGQTIDPVWVGIGSTFNLPPTGTFLVKSIRLVVADETHGGCGNDFAIDNITLSQCSSSGTAPVTFLSINARQKGSGVNVEWSTSQELNSKSFVVEKSADGNSNWNTVASIDGAGNSSTVKNYSAFDAQPLKGVNFYRIKQVDIDGNFKYSKTVSLKWNINKTGVSVLANPFHSSLTVNFSSSTNQVISARLVDITGKQVAAEKWSITTGNTRKDFSNVNGLQQGMYIITVSGANGEILYNNKVIKQ
jgi:hypothetical protein